MKSSIYLDYAAATPLDDAAISALQQFQQDQFFNASAVYQAAREVRKSLESARAVVANVLGSKDQEIIFTAGGTEANNLAIHGIMKRYPAANIVVSSIEHESVLEPANLYDQRVAPVTSKGIIDLAKLEQLIDDDTVLVSVMYANNEIGTIQPIKEVARIIQEKRRSRTNNMPLYLHTDACQAANYLDLQVTRLSVDMMTLNGGKIYGPKQSGALYVRAGTELASLLQGGGQEQALRSGTENVGAQVAFATMLQKVQSTRKDESRRITQLRDSLFANISQKIKNIEMNGDTTKRLPNNLNISILGAEGERLLMELDENGLMVATGSACTASNDKPSHVLLALGLTQQQASGSLRLTLGRHTTEADIQIASLILEQTIKAHLKLV